MINLYDILTVIPQSQKVEISIKFNKDNPPDLYYSYEDIKVPFHQLAVYNCFTTEFEDILYISCLYQEA